jgi:general secretion pathway protein G
VNNLKQMQTPGGQPQRTNHEESGYTLLELLVVMAIIGLLVAITAPQVMKILGNAKADAAKLQMESLAQALDVYQLDLGTYPTPAQGLKVLVARPAQASEWNGPYVRKARTLVDPWGRPFLYVSPAIGGPFEVKSLGADGKEGGDGDNRDLTSIEKL